MRADARQAWFPPAGAPHARFSSSFSSNPRPPPPGPCPRPSVCRGQPMALRHGATGRRPRAPRPRAWTPPAPGARGTEPGGGGCVGSAAPAAASHPWTGGAGCGLARRGRRRASGAVGGYVKPRMNGEQRCAIPAMAEGRRRGARKRSAPCRTRRRRGRRRAPCVRDRRAGRTGPAPPTGPGAGAKSTGSLVQRDMSLKGGCESNEK